VIVSARDRFSNQKNDPDQKLHNGAVRQFESGEPGFCRDSFGGYEGFAQGLIPHTARASSTQAFCLTALGLGRSPVINEPEAAAEEANIAALPKNLNGFAGLCISEATCASAISKPRSNVLFMLIVLECADQTSVSVLRYSSIVPFNQDHWIWIIGSHKM
jgi:hypothetical protein